LQQKSFRVKRWSACLLFLLFLSSPPPVKGKEFGRIGEHWRITGSVRGRLEYWNFFDPTPLPLGNENEYGFWAIQLRLGLLYKVTHLEAFVQGQWTHFLSLPDDASARSPQGDLGLGATYFAHTQDRDEGKIFLKQAYLRVKDLPLQGPSLKLGRFEYSDGLEVLRGDPTLDWLKQARLGGRLIGPFGFSHVTRSFDGLEFAYDAPAWNLTALASRPTQGGFEPAAEDEISSIDLLAVTLTWKNFPLLPIGEGRLFFITYQDDRNVPKVDNRPGPLKQADKEDIAVSTLGGHVIGASPLGPGKGDLLLWGVYQFGDWGTLDHRAWAVAAEAGYQVLQLPWRPWLRVGYFRGSGDSDPTDGDHETFFQILPTVRSYALFPFYNLMNLQDLFFQVILKPLDKLFVRADLHWLWLSEKADLWYAGSGATRRGGTINGFAGRPSFGSNELARVVDVTLLAAS